MFLARPLVAFLLAVFAMAVPATSQSAARSALAALEEWLVLYQQGKLDVSLQERLKGKVHQAKAFVSIKHGLAAEADVRTLNHEQELRLICAAVVRANDAKAAQLLLRVAAIGLEPNKLAPSDVPATVRAIGEEFAAKLDSAEAVDIIVTVARDGDGTSKSAIGRQAAALRVVGRAHGSTQRLLLEAALTHGDAVLRLGAAEGLLAAKQRASLPSLAASLPKESDERVAIRLVDAMLTTIGAHGVTLAAEDLPPALDAVLSAMSRFTWRFELAALDFLSAARSPRSVPVLIDLLDRYQRDRVAGTNKGSGIVPARAHETLKGLTGAIFGAHDVGQWRQWWQETETRFQLAPATPVTMKSLDSDPTRAASFFGLPVLGSRVVFILDISGSMLQPRRGATVTAGRGPAVGGTRWDVARREVASAIDKMGPDSAFNVVTFSAGADAWKPRPVPANAVNKKAFLAYLDKISPYGGTNLWGGLEATLRPKSQLHGDRLDTDADEIFLLSDGAPSVGDVVDPRHIVQLVRDLNSVQRIRIHTVYIGDDEETARRGGARSPWDMTAAELMRSIAQDNSGRFLEPK